MSRGGPPGPPTYTFFYLLTGPTTGALQHKSGTRAPPYASDPAPSGFFAPGMGLVNPGVRPSGVVTGCGACTKGACTAIGLPCMAKRFCMCGAVPMRRSSCTGPFTGGGGCAPRENVVEAGGRAPCVVNAVVGAGDKSATASFDHAASNAPSQPRQPRIPAASGCLGGASASRQHPCFQPCSRRSEASRRLSGTTPTRAYRLHPRIAPTSALPSVSGSVRRCHRRARPYLSEGRSRARSGLRRACCARRRGRRDHPAERTFLAGGLPLCGLLLHRPVQLTR
jgi:hypothetical protein